MLNIQAAVARQALDCVYEVSKTLVSSLDVAKTFRESLNYLVHAMEWRRAFVVLAEPDGQLHGLCAAGLSRDEQQRLHFRPGEGIVGRAFKSGIGVIVPDVSDEPVFLNRTGGADQMPGACIAMLATPIHADRRSLGVLAVDCVNPDASRLFADDLHLMKIVATLMGQALLLQRSGIPLGDVDLIEINEAFASVILSFIAELKADPDRVNPNGGAIALGHPLGATGGVLITKAAHELVRTGARYGVVTMCCGGGLGTATLLERL